MQYPLEIRVQDSEGQVVSDAVVTIQPLEGSIDVPVWYDPVRERYCVDIAHVRFARIVIDHPRYRSQKRIVKIDIVHREQIFILVRDGEPYAYIGPGPMPYMPQPELVGFVLASGEESMELHRSLSAAPNDARKIAAGYGVEQEILESLAAEIGVAAGTIEILKGTDNVGGLAGIVTVGGGNARRGGNAGEARKEIIRNLRSSPAIESAGPVYGMPGARNGQDRTVALFTNYISVVFLPDVQPEEIENIIESAGLRLVAYFPEFQAYGAEADISIDEEINNIVEWLLETGRVYWAAVEIVSPVEPDAIPNDYLWPTLWDRSLVGLADATGAWQRLENALGADRQFGDPNIVIGVVDGGVQSIAEPGTGKVIPQSLDLRGVVVSGVSQALTAAVVIGDRVLSMATTAGFKQRDIISIGLPGSAGSEEAVVKEVRANQLVLLDPVARPHGLVTVYADGDKLYRYYDFNGLVPNNHAVQGNHGLNCAGVATARANNADVGGNQIGVVGVAPNSRCMGIEMHGGVAFSEFYHLEMFLWTAGLAPLSTRIPAADRLLRRGADVISCSIGFGAGAALTPIAAQYLARSVRRGRWGRGCMMFFSAGNINSPLNQNISFFRPYGDHPLTFSCGASSLDPNGIEIHAGYSNYGGIEWCAPSHTNYGPPHDPPSNYMVATIAPDGRGDLPSHAAIRVAVDTVALVPGYRATLTQRVVAGGVVLTVNAPVPPPPIVNVGDFLKLGPNNGETDSIVQITAIAGNTITIAAPGLPTTRPVGTMVLGMSIMNVTNTAGNAHFSAGRWVLLEDPGQADYEPVFIRRKISDTAFEISGPLHAHAVGQPVTGGPNNFTSAFGGTSSATPLAAGISSLVLAAKPTLTWVEARELMRETTMKIEVLTTGAPAPGVGVHPLAAQFPGSTWMPQYTGKWIDTGVNQVVDNAGNLILRPLQGEPHPPAPAGADTKIVHPDGAPASAVPIIIQVQSTDGFSAGDFVAVAFGGFNPEIREVEAVLGPTSMRIDGLARHHRRMTRVVRVVRTRINHGLGYGIGTTAITLDSTFGFHTGDAIWLDGPTPELRRVIAVSSPTSLQIDALTAAHPDDAIVDRVGTSLNGPVPGAGPTTTITVRSTLGFSKGQAVLIGNIGAVGTEWSIVTNVLTGTTMEIYAVRNAHAADVLVLGGGIPFYSQWYGYGRLDAAAAVQAALDYDHDARDLMIRTYAADDGVAETAIDQNAISSPDIWIRTAAPVIDGWNALPVGYPVPESYSAPGPHQNPPVDGDRWIYARIKNRGNALESLEANARFYIYRSRSSEPFEMPVHWDDELPVQGRAPVGAGATPAMPAVPGIAANGSGTFFVDTDRPLYLAMTDENIPSLNGGSTGIYPGEHFIVKAKWNAADRPPIDQAIGTRQRTHLLVEITPHDGVLAGLDIRRNNNIASREITFAEATFRKNATDPLEGALELARDVAGRTVNFRIKLADRVGYFETEGIRGEIARRKSDGTTELSVYSHNGASWAASGHLAGVAFNPPVIVNPVTLVETPAAGDQIEVHIAGSFDVNHQYDLVFVRLVLQSHRIGANPRAVLSEYTHQILITPIPLHYSDDDIVTNSKPRFHVFAEMAKLSMQSAAISFGPKNANAFRATSGFESAHADVKAFAVVTGTVFVQMVWDPVAGAWDQEVANLILRPLRQSRVDFTPVKYFIYRGVRFADLFDLDLTDNVLRVQGDEARSELVATMLDQQRLRKLASGDPSIPDRPLSTALGWNHEAFTDPGVQPGSDLLDMSFYSSSNSFQFPVVRRGMSLGTFHNSRPFGFEIVLEEGDFRPDLEFARLPFYQIDPTVPPGTAADARYRREEILNFVDPAAYYGLHYDSGVEDESVIRKEADLYDHVIARFATRNVLYLDIRNENGYSLDYYGNYSASGNPIKSGHNLDPAILMERSYRVDDWPLYQYSGSVPTTDPRNLFFVAVRLADNVSPAMYVEQGMLITRSHPQNFVAGSDLVPISSLWTKELGFSVPGAPNPAIAGERLYVASIIKLHYLRQYDAATVWPQNVVRTEKYIDNVFGPLNTRMFWQPDAGAEATTWISAQDKKFIDASAPGSDPFFAYMAERGIALEPPGVAGGTARVVFFASAIAYMRDNPERIKAAHGIVGGYSSRGDLVESSHLFDGLDMAAVVIYDTVPGAGAAMEVNVPRLTSEAGSDVRPKDVLLLGITQAEYQALADKGAAELSPNHQMNVHLADMFSGVDAATLMPYTRYALGVRGWKKAPEPDGTHRPLDVVPDSPIYVYTVDGCFFTSPTFGTLQELPHYQPTPEELVADRRTEPDDFIALDSQMMAIVNAFGPVVSSSNIPNTTSAAAALELALKDYAGDILVRARAYAKTNYDDRQLYWARLQMTIRYQEHEYLRTNEEARKLLHRYFEAYSRGVEGPNGVSFTGVAGKKVLVIGFDPYALSPDIGRMNPAGVAALALHGETIAPNGLIQSIVLPVRYADLKDGWVDKEPGGAIDTRGLIEEIMPAYLVGNVDAIVVLGENGGRRSFDVERFAARTRGDSPDNNDRREPGPVGEGVGWDEFYESSLDIASMVTKPFPLPIANQFTFYDQSYQSSVGSAAHPLDTPAGKNDNVNDGTINPSGSARKGSGGDYIFNEVFYRIARLEKNTAAASTRVGLISMPTPNTMVPKTTMQDVVAKVKVLIDNA